MEYKHFVSKKPLGLLVFSFVVTSIVTYLSCNNWNDNPLDASFSGTYELSVAFDSLSGTLYPFRTYPVNWVEKGTDLFYRISLSTAPAGFVDTSIFSSSNKPIPLPIRFKGVFDGTINVIGVRPNDVTIEYPYNVRVVNPYKIVIDSTTLFGTNPVKLHVSDSVPVQSDSLLRVVWYTNGQRSDSLPFQSTFSYNLVGVDHFNAKAVICDYTGARITLDSVFVQVQQRPVPQVSFADASVNVPIGKPFTLASSTTNADSLRWQSRRLSKDTILAGSQITLTWTTSSPDTVIVTAKDRFGTTGNSDTIIVFPKSFTYDLTVVSFPTAVQTKKWNTWEVSATRNGQPVAANEVVYYWSINGNTANDSIRTIAGKREMFTSSEKQFTLSVVAVIGSDSTYRKSATIQVVTNKPSITVSATELTTPTNVPVAIIVRATAGDSAARISSVKFRTDDDAVEHTLVGDTLRLNFLTPGDKHTIIWAINSYGQTSDSVRITTHVTTTKPWFQRANIDTSVFIKDNFRFDGTAFSGSTNDSILLWKWDFDNNGTWDRTTYANHIDTTYSTVGKRTVRVWCATSKGDSAQTIATRIIDVVAGKPVVDSATLTTRFAYLNRSVGVRVFAHDTNGTIKTISLSWGQASPLQISTNKQIIDTTLQLSFATTGTYKITATATDEDGQVSDIYTLKDSLIVDPGTPRIKGLRPDTLWFKKDTSLIITAEDNGKVAGYAVSYDNSTFTSWSADSTFRHTFTDSGKQYLYLKVKDEDNNISAIIKDSVFVKAGYPVITGVTLSVIDDSLFVLDGRSITVTATDPDNAIKKVYINWNGGASAQDSVSVNGATITTTFNHTFAVADSGTKSLKVWCKDDDGLLSAFATKQVIVRIGRPVVRAITRDSARVWINDPVMLTAAIYDTTGTVAKVFVDWNNNGVADDSAAPVNSTTAKFTHSFIVADTGFKAIKYWCRDNDGLLSNPYSDTVTVLLGKPSVLSIAPDSNFIFINDARQFAIATYDTNGTVDSIKIDNGSGTFGGFIKMSNGAYTLNRAFARSEAGNRVVRVFAKDNDGVLSDLFILTVNVRTGAPIVDSVKVDTTGNNLFVKDSRTYTIWASDTNGSIKWILANWNGGSTPTDSVPVNFARTGSGTITHSFDTSMAGNRTCKFWVKDDDTIRSVSKDTVVSVRLGAPLVWGGDGVLPKDTLFIAVTNGYTTGAQHYFARPHSYDTNGVNNLPVKWFWNTVNTPLGATITSMDSMEFSVDGSNINGVTGFRYLFVQDDDSIIRGNISGNRFVVVADSAPPKPDVYTAGISGGNVTYYWSGKDAKDLNQTEYKIVIKRNADPTDNDSILVDFKPGTQYTISDLPAYDFKSTIPLVPPTGLHGQYKYRVIARDARLSISRSDIANFPY